MATCEVCENEYDKAFEVIVAGKHHTFDSFECAIHALAPVCPHCQCRVVGHGVEANGQIFCCVHCARTAGKTELKDRVWAVPDLGAKVWPQLWLAEDYFRCQASVTFLIRGLQTSLTNTKAKVFPSGRLNL
jgi:hypothetical protein